MGKVLIVATAGAGGDLQPLVAAALALAGRGHAIHVMGDGSVKRSLQALDLEMDELPSELDLGPALIGAIREAMASTGGDMAAAGPLVRERLTEWAGRVAVPVGQAVRGYEPDLVVTSLFGVEVLDMASSACPWAVINSTFYIGPNAPRPMEQDFAGRAVALLSHYRSLLGSADLVLHATDRAFDFGFDGLPPGHHYAGPLGIWEPPTEPAAYLDEPGDPWVLVAISSQMQDDVPLAQAALGALAPRPVRVLVTLGPDHDPSELSAIPPNARVEKVVSHSAVLERGSLLVSHAGHGSVMKALWHGRPMVLVPWGRDQPGVAARAAALGIARVVPREEASPERLGSAIDEALDDETMRERARQHSRRLRMTDPPAAAASILETVLRA
ncbi:MAG TPA: nucleotide disphospho-sugar-binding domain-containing protein [Actinomycetota bacterium]